MKVAPEDHSQRRGRDAEPSVTDAFIDSAYDVDHSNASHNTQSSVTSSSRKEDGLLGLLSAWAMQHQIGLSINLLLLLMMVHISLPRARQYTNKFLHLSYCEPTGDRYHRGWDDFFFISFWIVLLTAIRAVFMEYILTPLASSGGIRKRKTRTRIAEQGWLFLYHTTSWCVGMYMMYTSRHWFNLKELWTDFPTPLMTGTFKIYYLIEHAFWLQQILVVHIEKRRRDHWQMLMHHIITCALIFTSYGYYQTKVGNVILCVMDGVDILLALAKLLKYFGFNGICDTVFGLFIVAWFLLRHVAYMCICWSIHSIVPNTMLSGCYSSATGERLTSRGGEEIFKNVFQPFLDPYGTVCFNENIRYIFLGLLLALQVLTIIWFGMILRVAYRVLCGGGAEDSRSDEEAESDDEIDRHSNKVSITVHNHRTGTGLHDHHSVETLYTNRRLHHSLQHRKPSGRSAGLSISGHADKKELLGRIGCDKPI